MTAITISDRNNHALSAINISTQPVSNNEHLLEVEKQIAFLEKGVNAVAKKSFRSARFSLIKNLLSKETGNVLSFQSKSHWEQDEIIYKRKNITVFYTENYSSDEWENILLQNKISIIYIGTIEQNTLALIDYGYIIARAHEANIPVIFDNTYGGLGHIYAPLLDGADFVLTDVSAIPLFKNNPINAFIIEGAKGIMHSNEDILLGKSILSKLKSNRIVSNKNTYILAENGNFIQKLLAKEAGKYGDYSRTANYVARWLDNQSVVMEVNYAGLKSAASHIHAELYFKGGYGNILKFSLWDNEYSYSLLKGFFRSEKPAGILITTNNEKREFIVEVKTENYAYVLQFFQNVFSNLKQNVDFKEDLAQRNSFNKAFEFELRQLLKKPSYKRYL